MARTTDADRREGSESLEFVRLIETWYVVFSTLNTFVNVCTCLSSLFPVAFAWRFVFSCFKSCEDVDLEDLDIKLMSI